MREGPLPAGEGLTSREEAFWTLVRASHSHDPTERHGMVHAATETLSVAEIYHANAVIALFNFYNKFVDLNGVDELTAEGYEASGARLSAHGYAPPAR